MSLGVVLQGRGSQWGGGGRGGRGGLLPAVPHPLLRLECISVERTAGSSPLAQERFSQAAPGRVGTGPAGVQRGERVPRSDGWDWAGDGQWGWHGGDPRSLPVVGFSGGPRTPVIAQNSHRKLGVQLTLQTSYSLHSYVGLK